MKKKTKEFQKSKERKDREEMKVLSRIAPLKS